MYYITEIYILSILKCMYLLQLFCTLGLEDLQFCKRFTYVLQTQSIVSQNLSFQEDNGMFSGCYVLMYIEFKTVQTEVLNNWWNSKFIVKYKVL